MSFHHCCFLFAFSSARWVPACSAWSVQVAALRCEYVLFVVSASVSCAVATVGSLLPSPPSVLLRPFGSKEVCLEDCAGMKELRDPCCVRAAAPPSSKTCVVSHLLA